MTHTGDKQQVLEGNTEKELLLHRKFSMLQHYAENRANKTRHYFQERILSLTKSGKWLRSSSLERSFSSEVESGKDPVHSALLSAVSNKMLFCSAPWKDAKA